MASMISTFQRSRLASVVVCLALLLACTKEKPKEAHKMSPDELIATIETAGVKVEKIGSYNDEPNWEMNMKLEFDGHENYTAVRFSSRELARDYCQTQKHGVALDFWCIKTWDDDAAAKPAWTKVKSLPAKRAPESS